MEKHKKNLQKCKKHLEKNLLFFGQEPLFDIKRFKLPYKGRGPPTLPPPPQKKEKKVYKVRALCVQKLNLGYN